MRHKGKIGQDIDHPAVFPVALPQHVLETYTDAGDIVFEPFCGSGTTLLAHAADWPRGTGHRDCTGVCRCDRQALPAEFPEVPVTLVATGQTFDAVATERLGAPA
jgi:hypothetical protein